MSEAPREVHHSLPVVERVVAILAIDNPHPSTALSEIANGDSRTR